MTFDKFKKDFFVFLESSTVNLGRKTSKTRKEFMNTARMKFDAFILDRVHHPCDDVVKPKKDKSVPSKTNKNIICIKPKNRNKALDVGKGVHAMTPTESMRADEQLNRSPFGTKTSKGK